MADKKGHEEKIEVEPGADVRLANILKRSLNTLPKSAQDRREKKPKKPTK